MLGCELLRGQGFPGELKVVGGSFATNEFEQNKIEIPEVSDSWLKFNKFNCNCSTQFHFVPFSFIEHQLSFIVIEHQRVPIRLEQRTVGMSWYLTDVDTVLLVLFCFADLVTEII